MASGKCDFLLLFFLMICTQVFFNDSTTLFSLKNRVDLSIALMVLPYTTRLPNS